MKRAPKPVILSPVKPGQPPRASHENTQTDAIKRLSGGPGTPDGTRPHFKFMRLDEVLAQLGESDASFWDQEAVVQYFEESDHLLHDTSPEDRRRTITNPWPSIPFDEDQIVLCVQTAQSGKYMPVAPVTVRHAITVPEEGGAYPSCEDEPNVYPIKWTKKTWTKAAGRQTVSTVYLDIFDARPDDYVLNIYEGETSYLPAGTEIQCYAVVDRWYTSTCCGDVCESSSSSSQSISSSFSSQSQSSASSSSRSSSSASSESSSSRSSQSKSSPSSVSASSQSSSKSVSESSSVSASSASSVSESASSASVSQSSQSVSSASASSFSQSGSSASASVSASLSGDFTCITVVTGLSFDSGSCILTYSTRSICFPAGLGVTIGPES